MLNKRKRQSFARRGYEKLTLFLSISSATLFGFGSLEDNASGQTSIAQHLATT